MAVHQPHLLDFSSPPNAFNDDGLLALQQVDGGSILSGDTDTAPPWPPAAVSLSLFNYSTAAGASLVSHHPHQQQQPFTTAVSVVAPDHQVQQLTAAGASLQPPFQLIRSSRYLGPVKELLTEFCGLEGDLHAMVDKQQRAPGADKWEALSSGLWGSPSLSSMDLLELERRKARLMSMVQEVDRRYRRYREQMRSVELSLEAVAGAGTAQVYTSLARRAMSRHFRCLRDALVAQVRELRKAMGERDDAVGAAAAAAAGATKGDTPRLRVLDQCLRQQRAFQQPVGAMDNYPWRPQRGLPERAVAVLRAWLFEHFLHPYPNDVDKHILARQTGLSRSQVSNWFINARVRLWKPMIEEMYKEEVNQQQSSEATDQQKPISATIKAERSTTSMSIGGSYHSLANPSTDMISSGDHLFLHGYRNMTASAVSLTLGLQQRSSGLAALVEAEDHHQDPLATEGRVLSLPLPYMNLMGSQSLHDFAG